MKNTFTIILLHIFILCMYIPSGCTATTDNTSGKTHILWYDKPAGVWMESLPLGNGRLGITAFGGVETETITLNEITMWSGQYDNHMHRPAGKKVLDEIHTAFFAGDLLKVNHLASEHLAGNSHSFGSHVPLGDMKLAFIYPDGVTTDYKRELDLRNGIHSVTFKKGSVKYSREYICTNPDDVFLMRLSTDTSHSISFDLFFDMYRDNRVIRLEDGLEFSGTARFHGPGGVAYFAKVALQVKDGQIETTETNIHVKDATEVIIAFDVRTNYNNEQYKEDVIKTVGNVLNKDYDQIRNVHIKDHSSLYKRAEIYLGDNTEGKDIPTDERWRRIKETGNNDLVLDALFFHYGRYLLIASSRENSPLPANLQGIWNDNLACNMGWTNDYHLDINTQQNYWLSNVGNLHELNTPLFSYIGQLAEYGAVTAREVYGAKGWTAHTIANVWGYTASGGGVNWGLFSLASSWIASHLWTQYEYTSDQQFLEEQAYPLLKSNAEFILDYLVEDPQTGYLIGGPATSPENAFIYDGAHLSISLGTTADRQLAYEIFSYCIEASQILNKDEEFRKTLETAISKLSPMATGKNGGLQEWYYDFDEAQPNHRHTTHLLGLYPFSQISVTHTPELARAAQKTIELRLSAEGWEDVEWSRANMICMYARLLDAEEAYKSLVQLQKDFARENLLTISPEGIAGAPYDIFIFDGNEAGAAGIAEMLIQSHEGYLDFIPAIPQAWKDGFIKGLSVRGGADVNLEWKNKELQKADLVCTATNTFKIKLKGRTPKAGLNGKSIKLLIEDDIAIINLNKDDRLELIYK